MTPAEKKEKMERLHEINFVESPESIKPWEDEVARELAAKNIATREKLRMIAAIPREELGEKDAVMKDILDARQAMCK
ncbi:hypothetical protein [Bacillus cereus]|uniref:Uncharacterized protein n=1 Tax=Bacillus cereus TaxID=1396 RepID=A0AA44QBB2_BACCE|nr:hypothetical protein [Bacillus cereus]PFN08266.1 hypothetical protein COJ55_07000 [Bacillus cereus]PFS02705.1 hypothetical protein COK38_09080 [Bacillus cereus]